MIRLTRAKLPLLLLAALLGCTKTNVTDTGETETCGIEKSVTMEAHTASAIEKLEGTKRTFILNVLDNSPEDICSQEHVAVTFVVEAASVSLPPDLQFIGRVYNIGEWQAPLTYDSELDLYTGHLSAGFKQNWDETRPAYLGVQVLVEFTTKGSLDQDLEVLSHINTAKIAATYRQFKAKA
jgi:hypothetical protein